MAVVYFVGSVRMTWNLIEHRLTTKCHQIKANSKTNSLAYIWNENPSRQMNYRTKLLFATKLNGN